MPPLSSRLDRDRVEPEFLAQVREALGVHAAPILNQLAKGGETGLGELGASPEAGLRFRRDRDQAPLGRGLASPKVVSYLVQLSW